VRAASGGGPMPVGDRHLEQAIGSSDSVLPAWSAEDDRTLRAKYLDWCSARLAERFLAMTPEQIYRLAQETPSGARSKPAGAVEASLPDSPVAVNPVSLSESDSFPEIVERITREIETAMGLPDFETWVVAYRASPDQYEEEMLGFWRDRL